MNQSTLDKAGMIISIGCMIHCILLPIILPLLPLLGLVIGHDGYFHLILGGIIVVTAMLALIPGAWKHHKLLPFFLGFMGIMLIMASGVAELLNGVESKITITTILGSCFMVTAHYLNHRYTCACSHHKEHECH
jgi:hypothetical protein